MFGSQYFFGPYEGIGMVSVADTNFEFTWISKMLGYDATFYYWWGFTYLATRVFRGA